MIASEHATETERQIDAESSKQEVPLQEENKLKNWFIGSIDQGTTSTRFLIFNGLGVPVASHQIEFKQMYPHSGCVGPIHCQRPRESAKGQTDGWNKTHVRS